MLYYYNNIVFLILGWFVWYINYPVRFPIKLTQFWAEYKNVSKIDENLNVMQSKKKNVSTCLFCLTSCTYHKISKLIWILLCINVKSTGVNFSYFFGYIWTLKALIDIKFKAGNYTIDILIRLKYISKLLTYSLLKYVLL